MRNKKMLFLSPQTREEVDFFYDQIEEKEEFRKILKIVFFSCDDNYNRPEFQNFKNTINNERNVKFEHIVKNVALDGKIYKANLRLAKENNS